MKKGRFLWSAHRITERQKAGKARSIKGKQLKNSRNTVSKQHVVHLSSQRDKILYILGHISVRFITPQDFGSGVFFYANCDKIYITIVGILIRIPQDYKKLLPEYT